MLRWGATPDEVTKVCPGDELVADADGGATMATTLPAPPDQVWRWLVQMGGNRAGWYSWDWVDNDGAPSAEGIVPAWQHLTVGQHLPLLGMGSRWWTVVLVESNRTLVLQAGYGLLTSGGFDPQSSDPRPATWSEGVWGFHLRPSPGNETRLIVRTRNRGYPRWLAKPFGLLIGEPVHFVMQTRQLHNLRVRVKAERKAAPPMR
jgi:proline iminopeptidase